MRREILQQRIAFGERIPWGWGVAWEDPARFLAVCYPIPFNKVLGWIHRLYWNLVRPPRGPECEALRARIAGLERRVQFYVEQDRREDEFRRYVGRRVAQLRERDPQEPLQ